MSKLSKIIIAVIVLIAITSAGIFFFLNRTPDETYNSATTQVTAIQKASTTINGVLQKVSLPGTISDDVVTELKNATESYDKSVKALGENAVISRDATIKKTFEAESSSLNTYGTEANDILTGMDRYQATLRTCTGLAEKISTISTEAEFNKTATACSVSIELLGEAPGSTLKDQYLDTYTAKAKNLLTAYKKLATAGTNKNTQITAQSGVIIAKQNIAALRDTKLTLSLGDNATNSLSRINTIIATQKNTLIR